MVDILVDGKTISAEEGTPLLQACLDNHIYIPNLCFIPNAALPGASCRLCFVEVAGEDRPVTACTTLVREGLEVKTDTPPVRRLQHSALRFLLSVHEVDCGRCPANKKCALQQIARFLKTGLKPKGLDALLKVEGSQQKHPFLEYHPNRCVLCGKCIHVCRETHGQTSLTFAKRGFDTIVSFFGAESCTRGPCEQGFACVEVCPVAALTGRES